MSNSNLTSAVVPDEPLICPVSPGAALARLGEVIGACARRAEGLVPAALAQARQELSAAVEGGSQDAVGLALRGAQDALIACYQASEDEDFCKDAGFPGPGNVSHKARHLEAVDLSTLQVTFARYGKQVMVSFAFRDAPGATAYWLREVRYIDNENTEWARVEEQVVQSLAPLFTRVRLPSGLRHFRIEARNPSGGVTTEEFTIVVPEL